MAVARVTEIISTSTQSFEDAIKTGLDRANQTLRNVKSAWIKEQHVRLDGGAIVDYQVNMLVAFVLDECRDGWGSSRRLRRAVAPEVPGSSLPSNRGKFGVPAIPSSQDRRNPLVTGTTRGRTARKERRRSS